jgi:hypothetical protein
MYNGCAVEGTFASRLWEGADALLLLADPLLMEKVSLNQAQGDSRVRLVIGFARHWPGLFSVALGHARVPARGKRVRGRLCDELADDLGSWTVERLRYAPPKAQFRR